MNIANIEKLHAAAKEAVSRANRAKTDLIRSLDALERKRDALEREQEFASVLRALATERHVAADVALKAVRVAVDEAKAELAARRALTESLKQG